MASTLADNPLPTNDPLFCPALPWQILPPHATVPGIIYCAEKFYYQIMFVYVFCVSAIYIRVGREGEGREGGGGELQKDAGNWNGSGSGTGSYDW